VSGELRHPLFARVFHRLSAVIDRELAPWRRRLFADLHGSVIELGAGDGANFSYYPEAVERVVAIEPEPYLRARAEERARSLGAPIEVVGLRAERLAPDLGSFDFAVATLVFCSIGEPRAALEALAAVLGQGGELRFIEHVRGSGAKGALQAAPRSRWWRPRRSRSGRPSSTSTPTWSAEPGWPTAAQADPDAAFGLPRPVQRPSATSFERPITLPALSSAATR